jgi:hypothetical protein
MIKDEKHQYASIADFVTRFDDDMLEQGCYLRIVKLQNIGMACRCVAYRR